MTKRVKNKKNIKKYSTCENKRKSKKKEELILHLRINRKTEDEKIAFCDYNKDMPCPHEPELLKNNLNNIISNVDEETENTKNNEEKHIIINLMSDFIQGVNGKWPVKTNIYCYWCCHSFDNIPCGIPVKYVNETFYLSECFCSFNCTASYILNITKNEKWTKYSLLNLLYTKIYKNNDKVNLALDRKLLNIFGGYLTIDEFRKNTDIIDKKHNILIPPLISIIPKVEILKNNCFINDLNNFKNYDFNNMMLKNKKNTNTLANYMNVVKIPNSKTHF